MVILLQTFVLRFCHHQRWFLISESEIFEKSEIRKSKSFQNVKIGNQIMVKLLQTFVLRFYHHQRCFHIIIMISSVWIIIKFWKTSIMIILNIIMSNVDDPDLGFSLLLFDHWHIMFDVTNHGVMMNLKEFIEIYSVFKSILIMLRSIQRQQDGLPSQASGRLYFEWQLLRYLSAEMCACQWMSDATQIV